MKADGNYRKSSFLITLQKTSRHRVQTQQSHTVGHSARKFSWFSYVPVCNVSQHQLAPVDKGQAGKPQSWRSPWSKKLGNVCPPSLWGAQRGCPATGQQHPLRLCHRAAGPQDTTRVKDTLVHKHHANQWSMCHALGGDNPKVAGNGIPAPQSPAEEHC